MTRPSAIDVEDAVRRVVVGPSVVSDRMSLYPYSAVRRYQYFLCPSRRGRLVVVYAVVVVVVAAAALVD
jgi:hypothetical protein